MGASLGGDVVQLHDVSKRFGKFEAVKSVSWSLRCGGVYGLIGENGAGKSTLIRMICGLTRPTAGRISLFGKTNQKDIRHVRSRIGYVPDASASYPDLSARDNLTVRCIEWGIPQEGVIDSILQLVGLEGVGRKRARSFSMGMRRRLDLGIAFLGDPKLLILDEPTNGLDPMGIVEVRKLILHLKERGRKTILISSHNLGELCKVATHFAFMGHGRLLRVMTAAELDVCCRGRLVVRVDEPNRAAAVLRGRMPSLSIARSSDGLLHLEGCQGEPGDVTGLLSATGVKVGEVFFERRELEDVYSALIAGEDGIR